METIRLLFSDSMARAIVEGRKTVTRRPVKPMGPQTMQALIDSRGGRGWPCAPGDVLIGRECHAVERVSYIDEDSRESNGEAEFVYYRATPRVGMRRWLHEGAGPPERVTYLHESTSLDAGPAAKVKAWTPSIHMPDWAARIRSPVVSVTVERLQDITEGDAVREGMEMDDEDEWIGGEHKSGGLIVCDTARGAFAHTWHAVYAARGLGWSVNPWVWRIEFRADDAPDVDA